MADGGEGSGRALPQGASTITYRALMAVLGALMVVGAVAWALEIEYGLILTNMRDVVSWGLYISTFAWFVGVSAGGLMLSSAAAIFRIGNWRPVSKLASFTSAVVIAAAALIVVPDLGRPDRILNLIIYPHFFSPLIWDFSIIVTYFLLSSAEAGLLMWADYLRRRDEAAAASREKAAVAVAYVALPIAVFTHSITAWIFALQISRPWWNTALLAPSFVVSALVSGLALMLLVLLVNRRLGLAKIRVDDRTMAQFSKMLVVLIFVDLYFLFSEYLTIAWPGVPDELAALRAVFFGPYWWVGWGQWVLAALAIVILIRPRWRTSGAAVATATVLTLISVFFYRLNLVEPALAYPLITYPPGIAIGGGIGAQQAIAGYSFQVIGQYFPSPVEWAITGGFFLAGVAFVILLGLRYLPLGSELSSE
ncbi:MAG: NrfD/PsrC family molybdoenzyme membrane anchor subunit [Conexivisphaera sp.]